MWQAGRTVRKGWRACTCGNADRPTLWSAPGSAPTCPPPRSRTVASRRKYCFDSGPRLRVDTGMRPNRLPSNGGLTDAGALGEALLNQSGDLGAVDGFVFKQCFGDEFKAFRVLANDLGCTRFLVG